LDAAGVQHQRLLLLVFRFLVTWIAFNGFGIYTDPSSEDGWRKLNDCDDKTENAIRCVSEELQTKISSEELTKGNYTNVQDNMTRPSLSPSRY